MIHNINEYVEYLDSVRKRTMQYVKATPSFTLEWKPAENKFSTGDLLRHLGSSKIYWSKRGGPILGMKEVKGKR
ncbi:hypothetical protein [Cytobacillus citreus]|uniref:hypothetical protein n=1 Tax=Cytobacillus citreus TaxID=2833586 RepID=UPI002016F65C|nr:hypothetical protein [Cytobacillus citreus]